MEIKKKKYIITALFLILSHVLCAQEADYIPEEEPEKNEKGFYIEYIDDNPRFFQRLEWYDEEYVLYYEILILVDDNGYREYSRDITESNMVLVSLSPGKYRYSVTPFDLLGKRGEASEWIEFEILRGFIPRLDSFKPKAFHLDQNFERILSISGENFLEESEYFLQSSTGFLYPIRVVVVNNTEAMIYFDDLELKTGIYNVCVKNPGELETNLGGFEVDYNKPTDFFLKLAWAPAFSVYGYMNDILGLNMFPAGLSLTFQTVTSRRGVLNGGVELAASVFFLNPAISLQPGNDFLIEIPDITSDTYFATFDFNFILQRRSGRERFIYSFRFGIGFVTPIGFENYLWDNNIIFKMNIDVDLLIRLNSYFFLETGLDYHYYISPDISGILVPKLGIAIKF